MTTGVAGVTVKVALQVVVNGAQVLVYVKTTVAVPPHLSGAMVLLLESIPLQPPEAEAVVSQAAKEASIAACV